MANVDPVAPISTNASVKVAMCFLCVFSLFSMLRVSLKMGHNDHTLHYAQENLDAPSKIEIKMIGNDGYIEEEEQQHQHQQQHQQEFLEPHIDDDDESANDSFSACILWMDDNHRLEEWLAYHYYLLKLRYVVINIDPSSKTSPKAIIDRWNDHENKYNLNMTIVTMTNSDYMRNHQQWLDDIEKARSSRHSDLLFGKEKTKYHRKRQREFYKACSQHLMERNKSWTSYHDTDEFITFNQNHKVRTNKTKTKTINIDITEDGIKKMKQPGYVLHRLNSIKKQLPPEAFVNETGLSCLFVKRKRYCSNELSTAETNQLFSSSSSSSLSNDDNSANGIIIVPKEFMNSVSSTDDRSSSADEDRNKNKNILQRFDTLRYKYITPNGDGQPKSFIDLSQRNPKLYIENKWYSSSSSSKNKGKSKSKGGKNNTNISEEELLHKWETHRPMHGLCKKEEQNRSSEIEKLVREERFVVNHYLGSWASYSFRDDARRGGLRTYEAWAERSNYTSGEYSHVIRPWLNGFIDLVGGPKVASHLLQDAGKFPEGFDATARINDYNYTYRFNANPGDDMTRQKTAGLEIKGLEKKKVRKRKKKKGKK